MKKQPTENRRLIYIPRAKHAMWTQLVALTTSKGLSVSEVLIRLASAWVEENKESEEESINNATYRVGEQT